MKADIARPHWRIAPERELALDRPTLMGILNITPDSFSDGGRYADVNAAVDAALDMVNEGAAIIDIGGESTRPGAQRIKPDEQRRRVVPVIEALRRVSDVAISADTTQSEVAQAALDAGANIINDVAAGTEDDRLMQLAADRGCGVILMHRLRPPDRDSFSTSYSESASPVYADVVADVGAFLEERAVAAQGKGVDAASIVIDPGLGFGKTVAQNCELIARIDELADCGYPVLCAASRKSFLDPSRSIEPHRRVAGSIAAAVAMYMRGVRMYRVHDVAAHRQALAVAAAIVEAGPVHESPKPVRS